MFKQGKYKVITIIPARAGSKGLPNKNMRLLCGKPLVAWPIKVALESGISTHVVVSTDSQRIADIAESYGAEVPFLRPEKLASDTAATMDVILHCIDWYEQNSIYFDYVLLLEPTSPLTQAADIVNAFQLLSSNEIQAESIVGMAGHDSTHPEFSVVSKNGLLNPFGKDYFTAVKRRQDIDEVFFLDGSLYLSRTDALKRTKNFYHEKTMGYIVPKYKSFEIDDITDFICVEAIMKNLDKITETD